MKGLLHTQLVDGKPTAAIDIVLSLLLDVAQGLSYLHSKNILHGDLKPEVSFLMDVPASCSLQYAGRLGGRCDAADRLFVRMHVHLPAAAVLPSELS
jgi:serine/threonine protein kinase